MGSRAFLSRAAWIVFLVPGLLQPARAHSQYMYLDANSDGVNSSQDLLSATGPTQVDIWLRTDANRSGSPTVCSDASSQMTMNSYEFCLQVDQGIIDWGAYSNAITEFATLVDRSSSTHEFHTAFAGTSTRAAGTYKLGTLIVTVLSGSPTLAFETSSELSGVFGTTFGSACAGSDNDNTLKLGSDWFDADGITGSGGSAAPIQQVTVENARVILGGHFIDPPVTLHFHTGRLVVNDLGLPEDFAAPPDIGSPSHEDTLRWNLARQRRDLVRQAHREGIPDDVLRQRIIELYQSSGIVVSAVVNEHGDLDLRYSDKPLLHYTVEHPLRAPDHEPTAAELEENRIRGESYQLLDLQSQLAAGNLLVRVPRRELWVPAQKATRVMDAIRALQAGETLPDSTEEFLGNAVDRKYWPTLRTPVRLITPR